MAARHSDDFARHFGPFVGKYSYVPGISKVCSDVSRPESAAAVVPGVVCGA